MNSNQDRFGGMSGRSGVVTAGTVLALLITGSEAAGLVVRISPSVMNQKKKVATPQSKFYCNSKALTSEERVRHKPQTEKLMTARKELVESPKGYEFQFSPKNVLLADLGEWVAAEVKCCPLFDVHIDLQAEGHLLCLRLTGAEGIKAFISVEFGVG
jgi:hypothetical protein